MATNTPRHVATGIAGLDMVLGGGVLRRRLYVIEGPPGAGKQRSRCTSCSPAAITMNAACGSPRPSANIRAKFQVGH